MTHFRWVLAILAITIIGILAPSLVGARVFLGTDLLEAYSPWSTQLPDGVTVTNPAVGDTVDNPVRVLLSERLRSGHGAPLWDGFTHGGKPAGSTPNGQLYSPLYIGIWVLPAWYAPIITKLLELTAAVGFMYLFLRRLGLSRFAGLLAGLVYAFSGFQVVWTNWSQAHVGAFIPGLFWAVEYSLAKRTTASLTPLSAIVAVMWLEGFPAVTVYALGFAGAYAAVRIVTDHRLRRSVSSFVVPIGGVIAGTALAAFQLIPFAYWVRGIDTATRAQEPNWYLARRTLATLAVPNAFGSPVDHYYGPADYLTYGPVNYIEIQAFLGIAALALVALAAVYGRKIVPGATVAFLWLSVVVIVGVMYASGPLLDAVHALPYIGSNHIGRLRSVFLFVLAVLVGIGAEALFRGLPARSSGRQRFGLAAGLAGTVTIIGWALSKAAQMAAEADRSSYLRSEMVIATMIAVVVLVVVAFSHRAVGPGSSLALWLLPIVVAVEIVLFAQPFWPQVPRDQFYPTTPSHEFLEANLGGDRIATADIAMYPSTTTHWRIRSTNGHAFAPQAWKDALLAVDPEAFRYSQTFTTLRPVDDVAASPVLDRMGAKFFVAPVTAPLLGTERRSIGILPEAFAPGSTLDVEVGSAPLAGVIVPLPFGHEPGDSPSTLTIRYLDEAGELLTSGRRRIPTRIGPTELPIGIPTTPDGAFIRLEFHGSTPIEFGGRPIDAVVARPDLPVVFSGGTTIYRRTNALPRIRWASQSMVVPDSSERLAILRSGIDPSMVVLSDPSAHPGGGRGTVGVATDDGFDEIELSVSSDGPGFVVIADSLGRGWSATVDGESGELIEADHFGVALAIGEGQHDIILKATPEGWGLGLAVSFVTLGLLVAASAVGVIGRRNRRIPTRDAP